MCFVPGRATFWLYHSLGVWAQRTSGASALLLQAMAMMGSLGGLWIPSTGAGPVPRCTHDLALHRSGPCRTVPRHQSEHPHPPGQEPPVPQSFTGYCNPRGGSWLVCGWFVCRGGGGGNASGSTIGIITTAAAIIAVIVSIIITPYSS